MLLGVLLCALLVIGPHVLADQTDPRLTQLFTDLGNADGPREAREIEQKIWTIWFESNDPNATETLDTARETAERGSIGAALQIFDGLVVAHPEYAEGWNQRAIMRFLTGDIDGSLEDIAMALKLEPRHFGAWSGRGQCYLNQKRYPEAIHAFESALDINPWIDSVKRQIDMLKAILPEPPKPI